MSNENKIPLNLYGILDNELNRMHDLMRIYLSLPRDSQQQQYTTYSSNGSSPVNHSGMGKIYERIVNLQDLLLQSVISHDKVLQEKIAELALTGTKDEST